MMCIVRDPEKQTRRPENMVIIRNAGTFGRMEFAPRRIIHSSIVENVGTKDIRSLPGKYYMSTYLEQKKMLRML